MSKDQSSALNIEAKGSTLRGKYVIGRNKLGSKKIILVGGQERSKALLFYTDKMDTWPQRSGSLRRSERVHHRYGRLTSTVAASSARF